jgi:hypothetical protein
MGAREVDNTVAAVTSISGKRAESTGDFRLAKDITAIQRRVASTQTSWFSDISAQFSWFS